MAYPNTRMRRLRASAGLRGLVRETGLRAEQLVLPLFVRAADAPHARRRAPEARGAIATMPGVARLSLARGR